MAKIGIKCLTYAKYKDGGRGSAVQYEAGKMKEDYMAKADLTITRNDTKEYGDDHQIDSENGVTAIALALELTNTDEDIETDMLGEEKKEAGKELAVTDADAPFVGVGFYMKNRFRGTSTFDAYWAHKMQFSRNTVSAETRREQTNFVHETINGSGSGVQLDGDGKTHFYCHEHMATEAEAKEWLKKKANITASA